MKRKTATLLLVIEIDKNSSAR